MLYRQHYEKVGRIRGCDLFVLFISHVDRAFGGMNCIYDCCTVESKSGTQVENQVRLPTAMTNLLEKEQAGKQ